MLISPPSLSVPVKLTNHKFLVSSQARNNSYDDEKSVTENWDSNPIIAYALGSSIPLTHKETCDGHYAGAGDLKREELMTIESSNGQAVNNEKRYC